MYMCGVVRPAERVRRVKRVKKHAISHCFLQIFVKAHRVHIKCTVFDAHQDLNVIYRNHELTSPYNTVTSRVTSLVTAHAVGHVTFDYKRACAWYGLVLLPETFK